MSARSPAYRRYVRYLLEFVGQVLLKLLSRTSVTGAERVPRRGPFIVAGNHRAVMEIFLMLAVTKPQIDIIGAGDMPLDPSFRWLAHLYGYIPYRRGSVDGVALRRALRILNDGGVVGIFPEGGIWTNGPKDTQRGVAWLAAQSGAPVIPMGFAGIDRGVERVMQLEFPRFEVHAGELMRYEGGSVNRSRLDEFSERVMGQVDALLPEWDRRVRPVPERDEYSLILRWTDASGGEEREMARSDPEAAAVSRFYHLPVLLSIFRINLRRDVGAMEAWDRTVPAGELAAALRRIIGYVRLRNRYLFTYRLGMDQGRLLLDGLASLRDWLSERPGALVSIVPVRRVSWQGGRVDVLRAPQTR